MDDMHTGADDGTAAPERIILLVDDEADVLLEYQELLQLEGFDALVESDPEAALQTVLHQAEIALVVTDLRMAKLDGAGLIRALRSSLPRGRDLGFIVLTGDATSPASVLDLEVPVLIKPVDFEALLVKIQETLGINH